MASRVLTMLKTKRKSKLNTKWLAVGFAGILLAGGLYVLTLVLAPMAAPIFVMKVMNEATLPAPDTTDNRIIIPKIGVSIAYDKGPAALDRGAEWRAPASGNPKDGGNFVIAAHRFSIQPTPRGTIEKSPFYSIDKLVNGDKIIVDYLGIRYSYTVARQFNVKPTQVEIENRTDSPTLTLYSCGLDGSDGDRYVIQATPQSA